MPALIAFDAAVVDRIRGSLWGTLVGDALSMPVHWYYQRGLIQRDFGYIRDYQPPKKQHPGSIMAVSNTGGHGRGGQGGRIIGDVINHGKHAFWGQPGVHYHQGMKAGENTLNALCARLVTRGVARRQGDYPVSAFLEDYVGFMTTPGSHNDTYAESFHRDFFANWAAGVPPDKCCGKEGHNTPTIGGFVMLPPVAFAAAAGGETALRAAVRSHLGATHDSALLSSRAESFASLLAALALRGAGPPALHAAAKEAGLDLGSLVKRSGGDDGAVVGGTFSTACYITDSWPSVLYLAAAHAGSFEDAVLANTNLGGENCHRGSALGAVMGAMLGEAAIPARLRDGLADSAAIKREIDEFVGAVVAPAPAGAAAAACAPVA